ncbi:hypothetical protein [Spirosoma panaciterrae]|uniref:hypothetical protein n=1 Tax=Spirosoma panaciterrae TaxID=496058 RepID=UPI001B7FD6AA|nr:hypothetical protein [Spirosoma panaciterrae]
MLSTITFAAGAPARCYDTNLSLHLQRHSNNYQPEFTDQEIQDGSKVRSSKGALLHCFGRLAAGL